MDDLWLYVHLGFLIVVVVGSIMADHLAYCWMRGKKLLLEKNELERAHWIVTIGLTGLVFTGLYLFWPQRDYLLEQPTFWLKMFFVLTLLINSFLIESLMPHATRSTHAALDALQKRKLMLSGGISTVSWLGTIIAAIYLFGWPF